MRNWCSSSCKDSTIVRAALPVCGFPGCALQLSSAVVWQESVRSRPGWVASGQLGHTGATGAFRISQSAPLRSWTLWLREPQVWSEREPRSYTFSCALMHFLSVIIRNRKVKGRHGLLQVPRVAGLDPSPVGTFPKGYAVRGRCPKAGALGVLLVGMGSWNWGLWATDLGRAACWPYGYRSAISPSPGLHSTCIYSLIILIVYFYFMIWFSPITTKTVPILYPNSFPFLSPRNLFLLSRGKSCKGGS